MENNFNYEGCKYYRVEETDYDVNMTELRLTADKVIENVINEAVARLMREADVNCIDEEWMFEEFQRRIENSDIDDFYDEENRQWVKNSCGKCNNVFCKYHNSENPYCPLMNIASHGHCENFEKGFAHYISLVGGAMGVSNFIDYVCLTDDVRLGLYYAMEVYGLKFKDNEWGYSRFITLHKEADNKALNFDEIVNLPVNVERWNELYRDYMRGKIPHGEKLKREEPVKDSQPFGWLSPSGEFIEGDFGEHEEVAFNIIESKGWEDAFLKWKVDSDRPIGLARDYICEEKGWCLIHNPSGYGGYIVTNMKPLTKKQKDFLFNYFMEIGDMLKAERYLDD